MVGRPLQFPQRVPTFLGMSSTQVGTSQNTESRQAGLQAAGSARERLEGEATWALAFIGGRHDPEQCLAGIREKLGPIPVYGGAAAGIVSHDLLGYSGYEVGVAASNGPAPQAVRVTEIDQDERSAGRRLGEALARLDFNRDTTTLLFYDSVRRGPPPVLNVGSALMNGIYDVLPAETRFVGCGTTGDLLLSTSHVLTGHGPEKQVAVALVMQGRSTATTIMHGCEPLSAPFELTRIDGPDILEIDGRPALDVILETTGIPPEAAGERLGLWVTLGAFYGDPDIGDAEDYVNRLILSFDAERRTIRLFEDDFQTGDHVQVMLRDNQAMLRSASAGARDLVATAGTGADFALYIDCAGRSRAYSGAEQEEAALVQAEIPKTVPLLGLYSGVEIGPLSGRSRPLDWTGVLSLVSR